MLPRLPHAFHPDFAAESSRPSGTPVSLGESPAGFPAVDHHCQICPTCGHQLTGHRCKLVCSGCGYYMSCADYY